MSAKNDENLAILIKKILEEHLGKARAEELLGEVWLKALPHLDMLEKFPIVYTVAWILRVARCAEADERARSADVFGRKWPRPPVKKVKSDIITYKEY